MLWFPYCGGLDITLTVYRTRDGLEVVYPSCLKFFQGATEDFLAWMERTYGKTACLTRECRAVIDMARARIADGSDPLPVQWKGN